MTLGTKTQLTNRTSFALLVALLVFLAYVRYRISGMALERDEGEFAYMAQLLLDGLPPFDFGYNMKMSGIYYVYAGIMSVFGQSKEGIHFGLAVFNLGSTVLVYFLGRRLSGNLAGVTAAAAFGLLSCLSTYLGSAAHATQFLVFFALSGLVLLLRALEKDQLRLVFLSGLAFGCAFMMKQPGLLFFAFAAVWLGRENRGRISRELVNRWALLVAGLVVPFATIAGIHGIKGDFSGFWYWTVEVPWLYGTDISLGMGMASLWARLRAMVLSTPGIYVLATIGLAGCVIHRGRTGRFALLFAAFSFLAVLPGLYFRHHYFILWLPSIAILAGIGIETLHGLAGRWGASRSLAAATAVLAVSVAGVVVQHRQYLFTESPEAIVKRIYRGNPFQESLEIADHIRRTTSEDDTVAILGSEAQILFYSGRRSATGFIYVYTLMDPRPHGREFQDRMIAEIEEAKPEIIVFANVNFSWLGRPESDRHVVEWFQQYAGQFYRAEGIVELVPDGESVFKWDEEAEGYRSQAQETVLVFRRRDGSR